MAYKDMWHDVPKPIQIIIYTILGVIAAFGFGLLFGWIVVWLWNWLMPMIFGLPTITFWQGAGIFILAKILFGGFGHSESSKSGKKKRRDKGEWSFEWDGDTGKGKFGRWEHYDEWWKTEGKASFERYAQKTDEAESADIEDDEDLKEE